MTHDITVHSLNRRAARGLGLLLAAWHLLACAAPSTAGDKGAADRTPRWAPPASESSIPEIPPTSRSELRKSTYRFVPTDGTATPPRTTIPDRLAMRQIDPGEARPAAPYTFAPLALSSTDIQSPAGELPAAQLSPVLAQGLREDETLPPLEGPVRSTSRARHFCHRPLYFEDRALERDGVSVGVLQPAVSAFKFFGAIPFIPYKLGSEPPRRIVCTTGTGRPGPGTPGNLSPTDRRRGVLYQAGAALGLVFVLP